MVGKYETVVLGIASGGIDDNSSVFDGSEATEVSPQSVLAKRRSKTSYDRAKEVSEEEEEKEEGGMDHMHRKGETRRLER